MKFGRRAPRRVRAVCAGFAAASLLASTTLTPAMAADVGSLLSPAVLARASGGTSAASPAGQTQILNSPALQAQLALSAANLARAAKDISDITAAQAAASASSQLTLANAPLSGSSWNGTALSGLNPRDSDPTLWINADPLQKDAASATATVKQNAATALLTWQSFDLNKGEKLVFDQQGNADWTVLNRVVAGPRDASGSRFVASPSMILGSIQAPGSVYVINPNGVVFGPTAQINVHSLIASSLDVGAPTMATGERNSFFLNTGILGSGGNIPAESFSYNPGDSLVEGDIIVEEGAKITASLAPRSVSPDSGGFVYLFAPNVENRGTISTPAGETLMVAAQAVQLIANGYPDGFSSTEAQNVSSTFRAVGVNTVLTSGNINGSPVNPPIVWRTDGAATAQISTPGKVTNSGLIDAERGVIILNGDLVTNGSSGGSGPGVIRANTSVTRNGQIFLDAHLQLTLAGGSIQVLPAENGETIPDSAIGNFAPGKVEMRGQTIDIEPGTLIEAPGGSVSITRLDPNLSNIFPDAIKPSIENKYPQRIYMATDSAIDVSGLQGVERPMSDNFLTFKPFGNEFADQPLQRNAALRGQQLTVDLRQSGTLNGTNWIGTPLANLAGFATSVSRTIDQLLTTGGNVTLSSPVTGDIVLRQGSSINVGGGTVHYAGDSISATRLFTADGRIVSISRADPLDTYIGIAGISELQHPHWGDTTTESFAAPLLSGAAPEPGYTEGHDAGAITLDAAAYVLDGDLYAGVTTGEHQRALGQRPSSGDNALAMPNAGSFTIGGLNNLTLSGNAAPVTGNFDVLTPLSSSVIETTVISAQKLSDAGFAKITANFSGQLTVTADATLTAAPGGTIALSGGSVDVEGRLVAHSGAIAVDSSAHVSGDILGAANTQYSPTGPARPHNFDLVTGSAALLDVSGLWVNDNGAGPADLIGGAYIDGGVIDLKTEARSAQCFTSVCKSLSGLGANVPANVDLTGDIVLAQGVLLDASSGGRITDRGVMMLDSKGRAAGKGGNVSLTTYAGGFATANPPLPVTATGLTATIRLPGSDGSAEGNGAALAQSLHGYGFAQGGTLNLQAPSFDIGSASASGGLALAASFFDGNGFGAYSLNSVAGHNAVAPGTALVLRQRNLVAGAGLAALASGEKVSQIAAVDFLPDFIRQPVNLTLSAALPIIPSGPYDPAAPVPTSTVALSLGQGASIQAEPGAKVSIGVTGRGSYEGSLGDSNGAFSPTIAAQTAVAEILGSISAPGGIIQLTAGPNARLWLGADSRLDVSGIAMTDSRQTLFRTGTVLPGGSVSITATDAAASVIGLHGALIDVSGSVGVFDLPVDAAPTLAGQQSVATTIWSDAGSIVLSAPTLLYDGAFAAQAGSPQGNGGSLTVASPQTNAAGLEKIVVRQGGDAVPSGFSSTGALGALAGSAIFLADRLTGSGIQSLTLTMGQVTGDAIAGSQGRFAPGTLTFSGNVTLGGLNTLFLDASQIALVNTVAPTDPRGCNVCLDAGTIALRGAGNVNRIFPTAGTGILRVAAGTIDIAAGGFAASNASNLLAISGAAKTSFISAGDIRLRVPLANAPLDLTPATLPAGELISAGDLTLAAAQIYPISAVDFTLKSSAPNGTIAFVANGAPRSAPLSAGGQVTVSAAHIDQSGILLAPLGVIRLGAQSSADLSVGDPTASTVVATQSVAFGPGSVTSVSLAGQNVPFGQTANATSWSYDSFTGQPLTAPPAKDLIVSAATIGLSKGATIDLTGGGDLQAIEFVPGTGGTRDVLAASGVYAIIPGYDPATAPIDLDFAVQRHDVLPSAGSKIYLSGQGGVAAGFYTLLPAHYATLPGAYRVAVVNNSTDALSHLNQTLPDGTLRTAGYFANGLSGTRSARLQYFDVQSSSVWRQYSEIDQTSGDAFFGAKTLGASGTVSRLPTDAGHAVFGALNAITLQGDILAAPATGGRGAEFDIAASDIQILSPGATARSGYVGLDSAQLSNLAVDSLLLGGIRSDGADGQTVTVIANSIEVSNDASAPLERPEVILVTRVALGSVDPNASRGLQLDVNAVVQAKGSVVNPAQKKIIIGSDAQKIAGNGALLAVSNGAPLAVERQRVSQNNGVITLAGPSKGVAGLGAVLSANSLTLDTSGNIRPGAGVILSAQNISISAKSINFGAPQNSAGFNIDGAVAGQLEQASNLSLRSLRTMDFSGPVNFALGAGSHLVLDSSALVSPLGASAVGLRADRIDWINSGSGQNPAAAGNAALTLTAAEVDLGAGGKSLSGFGSAAISASSLVALHGAGSLDGGSADLSFQTPLLLVGSDANQSMTTGGAVRLAGTGSAATAQDSEVGGIFALTGRSLSFLSGADLQAIAGGVTLTATSGDIVLGSNARVQANGFVSTFFDVTKAVGGGSVQLVADQGSIDIDHTAAIDISSPVGQAGYAGQIELHAANGNIQSNGAAFDMDTVAGSVSGDRGGRLTIDAQSLGSTSISLPGLFDAAVDLHLRQGDVQIVSDVRAASVTLTADGGLLTIAHTIDTSGDKGGSISLFGSDGVVIAPGAKLLATASDPAKRGGDILIGTRGAGVLDLQGGLIDVSNTADAANGGTVRLRTPLTGVAYDDVAINPVGTVIQGASSVTVEGYRVFDTHNSAFQGVIDPLALPGFFGSCNAAGICSGTLIDFVQKFALSAAAQSKFSSMPSQTLHLQPGIELVNNDLTVNGGDITVANAWNLGSGVAGYLVSADVYAPKHQPAVPAGTVMTDVNGNLLPQYAGYTGDLIFVPGVSQITSLYYRVGGSVTGEAGSLTLRAVRDVNVNDSITDGFFNTRNTFDHNYQQKLAAWINSIYTADDDAGSTNISNVGGYLIAGATYAAAAAAGNAPLAPYDAGANGISPVFSPAQDKTPISGADLFPLIADPSGPIQGAGTRYSAVASWSYRIVAGADTASANPLALQPRSVFDPGNGSALAGHGNVTLNGHDQYNNFSIRNAATVGYFTPTMIRTGTGSIDIAAGLDFILADTKAPGVVYTAGRNSVALPDPGFVLQTFDDPFNPGQQKQIPVATDAQGFLAPQVITCDLFDFCNPYGPATQAAYPVGGGRLTLTAQRDIVGYQRIQHGVHAASQFFAPWLLAQGTSLSSADFGVFAPLSTYFASSGVSLFTPSQTSWWINFGSFDQGVMSVGGDVTVKAGLDIQELSVSLPTTVRVSGGLSSTIVDANGNTVANIPVVHLNNSGDLTVIAGRDLKSGTYYEGSGNATILVGGAVSASLQIREDPSDPTSASHPVSTILAVDSGKIVFKARGDIDLGGIVSGPSLQNVANASGVLDIDAQSVSSYGPSSAVSLLSVTGDVVANSLGLDSALIFGLIVPVNSPSDAYPGVSLYPANFEAVAANGNVNIEGAFRLASSQTGTLSLLAHGSLLTSSSIGNMARPISTGASLVEAAFDAVNPLAGFAPGPGSFSLDLGSLLLHQNDPAVDRIYAATGDIVGQSGVSADGARLVPLAWEITKPAKVEAARDIIDFSFMGQNLAPTDITSIVAGRDIFYTGAWQNLLNSTGGIPDLKVYQNLGGLSLAGPGFFEVQAGRNLGPFVTAAADIVAGRPGLGLPSDSIGTGIVTFGNTIVVGNRRMFSSGNANIADPFALGADNKLVRRGADIIALFGVANGVDYDAVIRNYVDPATSTSPRDYLPSLATYLQTLGYPVLPEAGAWSTFKTLPAGLQQIFADKVFMNEIRLPGNPESCCFKDYSVGYSIINTLFPASLGYTNNTVAGGTSVVNATGNLDLLHATIKTLQSLNTDVADTSGSASQIPVGGDITVLGPGGSINVGTTALEINPKLSNSSVGILTLDNGAINVFTDVSVLVNQSRILTVQGGDILMWSSNGDLDAGRGAKTTVDFKPLSVNFDPSDLQTINLNGLVSGAGIGTIRSTPDAPSASTTLIAPRGTVNAGDAGLRSSGNLDIAALLVLNAANIAVAGSVSGVPEVSAVNISALESASSSGGQAARIADDSVAATARRGSQAGARTVPSLITVEVLGFGDCDPEGGRGCSIN